MNFYLLVPWLFRVIASLRAAILFTIGSLAAGIALSSIGKHFMLPLYPDSQKIIVSRFFDVLWLPSEMAVFGCGFILYFLFRDYHDRLASTGKRATIVMLISAVAAMLALTPMQSLLSIYPYAILFVIFSMGLAANPIPLFVNEGLCYVGRISYSMYLVHTTLLCLPLKNFNLPGASYLEDYLMAYLLIVMLSILLSSLTYRFIEIPGIALGKRLVIWLEDRDARRLEQSKSSSKI